MTLLQIYHWVCQWKNFENRSTFGEFTDKSIVGCFLTHSVNLKSLKVKKRLLKQNGFKMSFESRCVRYFSNVLWETCVINLGLSLLKQIITSCWFDEMMRQVSSVYDMLRVVVCTVIYISTTQPTDDNGNYYYDYEDDYALFTIIMSTVIPQSCNFPLYPFSWDLSFYYRCRCTVCFKNHL